MDTSGLNNKGDEPWNKGKTFSPEARAKMSVSHKASYANGLIHPMLGRKHSRATKAFFQEQRVGKPHPHKGAFGANNPFWKGGITPIHRIVRVMPQYKSWRQAVFQRDNYTCKMCGDRGGILNADHIVPFSYILEREQIRSVIDARNCSFLWNIENGRTLCETCHKLSPSVQYRVLVIIRAQLKAQLAEMQKQPKIHY
jgi:hypothetical protein